MLVITSILVLLTASPVLSSPQATTTVTASPTTASASPQYTSDRLFTSAILNSTNTYRLQHSAHNLTYNATLSRFASTYLSSDKNCTFAHSGGPYGENIAIGYPDVVAAIDAWGDERRQYDFDKGDFTEATGHFTQLVWENTTTVGCGRLNCGEGKGWFLVCEYWPRGNVIGQFVDNVEKPIEGVDMGAGGRVTVGVKGMVVWCLGAGLLIWIW